MDFFIGNHKDLAKLSRLLVRGFFLEILKIHRLVWIFYGFSVVLKEGGLYYMGGTYFFFSSKMEQTLHSPSHGSEEPPHEEKIVKKYF
jgi:hypothetical protein